MKKSLVLAMAMALGVTASAYAANPFSDVPAGHWAYDSVAKLAAAGVVDGYADGAFDGDKLMTRYEMAQIVAKAMAKGADCDKLAAEFADELDTLGVRVAKLEKGADAVKITGQMRYSYKSSDYNQENAFRTRLWINGQINDNWSYTGMLQHWNDIDDDKASEDVYLRRAYLEGRLGGLDVVAGRWNEFFYNANILDIFVDGVKVTYGDKVKLSAMVGKPNAKTGAVELVNGDNDTASLYAVNLSTKVGAVDVAANYFNADEAAYENVTGAQQGKKEIYNINLGLDVAKDLRLSYEYMWGDDDYLNTVSKDGYWARLDYKGAGEEPGTWGIHAQLFDQPINCYLSPTTDATTFTDGYEGWGVGVDYTLAKNIQLCVNYYDTESIKGNESDEVIYTEVYFNF